MAELVFYDQRNFSHPKYYHTIDVYNRDIHPKLEEKFFRDKKLLETERQKAEIMTEYFGFLKKALELGEQKQAIILPDESLKPLIDKIKTQKVLGFNKFINYYSGKKFESDLVTIINDVAKLQEKPLQNVAHRTGGYQAAPDLYLEITKDIESEVEQFVKKSELAIVKHKSVPGITHRLAKRDGLIDVRVDKSSLNLEFNIDMPALEKFWWALDGAQFSAKNYLLTTIQKFGIGIGKAKSFRQIGSALNFVLDNPNSKDVQKIFFASMNTKNLEAVEHLKHLAAIYELAGAGQIYYRKGSNTRLDFGIANYLIVNINSTSAPIKVYSIRALIQDYVMGTSSYGSKITVGENRRVAFSMEI